MRRGRLKRHKRRIAIGATLAGFALAALLAPPTPPQGFSDDLEANLAAQAAALLHLEVDPERLRALPVRGAALGQRMRLYFEAGAPRDLYTAEARVSGAGIPVEFSDPINLTRSPKVDDAHLLAREDALIYTRRAPQEGDSVASASPSDPPRLGRRAPRPRALRDSSRSVVLLDFRGEGAGFAEGIAARQLYGRDRLPRRVDVLLGGAEARAASLEGDLLRLETSEGPVEVDLARRAVRPEGVKVLFGGSEEQALHLWADNLRRIPLLGPSWIMALEEVAFEFTDQLRQWRHDLPFTEAAPPVQIHALAEPLGWPPADLHGDGDLPEEGRWVPLPGLTEADPARRTFLRVDPKRPYQRVYLFAFDSQRLQLRFAGGVEHPRGDTGARGSGRIPEAARPRLLAAFNGGFKAAHGAFGAVESGRIIVSPKRGAATVAMTAGGRAAFGIWDVPDGVPERWLHLRQNLTPLIAEGIINPSQRRRWGGVVARLDAAHTPRSALGVTDSGILLYAWSEATSAEGLAQALAQVGARAAMHLDLNPGHTGLVAFAHEGGAPQPRLGAPGMDISPRRFTGVAPRDFFYLTRLQTPPPRWRPVAEGVHAAQIKGRWVYRFERRLTRMVLIPGLREPRPLVDPRGAELVLEGAPSAWLPIGLRRVGGPMGFIVDKRPWRPLKPEAATLTSDAHGHVALDAAPKDPVWAIQGGRLLRAGRLVDTSKARVSAMGLTEGGALLYAQGEAAEVGAALREAGAREAIILGGDPEAEVDLIEVRGGDVWLRRVDEARARRGALAAQGGSALLVLPRAGVVGAWVTRSFH